MPFIDVSEKKIQLFFIPANEIIGKEETKSGVITDLTVSPTWQFREIKIIGKPIIIEKKRGLAKVVQDIELEYDNSDNIFDIFAHLKIIDMKISILKIDEHGKGTLMGENNGMKLVNFTKNTLKLSGEEQDVFYKLSAECVQKMIN